MNQDPILSIQKESVLNVIRTIYQFAHSGVAEYADMSVTYGGVAYMILPFNGTVFGPSRSGIGNFIASINLVDLP